MRADNEGGGDALVRGAAARWGRVSDGGERVKEAGQQQFEAVTPSDKAGNVAAPCLLRSTTPTTRKYCPLALSPEACRAGPGRRGELGFIWRVSQCRGRVISAAFCLGGALRRAAGNTSSTLHPAHFRALHGRLRRVRLGAVSTWLSGTGAGMRVTVSALHMSLIISQHT